MSMVICANVSELRIVGRNRLDSMLFVTYFNWIGTRFVPDSHLVL